MLNYYEGFNHWAGYAIPRPPRTFRDPPICRACGAEYYPEDIPDDLIDVGPYHTCADCRLDHLHESDDWSAWARAVQS